LQKTKYKADIYHGPPKKEQTENKKTENYFSVDQKKRKQSNLSLISPKNIGQKYFGHFF